MPAAALTWRMCHDSARASTCNHTPPRRTLTPAEQHTAVQSVPGLACVRAPSIVLLKLFDNGLLLVELRHLAGGLAVLVLQLLIRAPAMPSFVSDRMPHTRLPCQLHPNSVCHETLLGMRAKHVNTGKQSNSWGQVRTSVQVQWKFAQIADFM